MLKIWLIADDAGRPLKCPCFYLDFLFVDMVVAESYSVSSGGRMLTQYLPLSYKR